MDLQKKAVEIATKYESLPMKDKIGIIAQTFGCTSGEIVTSPCTGKWRGTSDMSIRFDNGVSLFLGNERTPQTKTAKVRNKYVNATLMWYNPEIVDPPSVTSFRRQRRYWRSKRSGPLSSGSRKTRR